MMAFRARNSLLIVAAVCCAISTGARIVPGIDLRSLVTKADVIVVGWVVEVGTDEGLESATATAVGEQLIAVEVKVARVLKGQGPVGMMAFTSAPAQMAGLTGPITQSRFGMFFLRRVRDGLSVVNPYYPVLPANENAIAVKGTPFDRVVGELVQLLGAERTSQGDLQATLYALRGIRHPLITDTLRRSALKDDERSVMALAELLSRGDVSLLAKAERILTSPSHHDAALVVALGESLSNVSDAASISALSQVIRHGVVEARRGAATALGNTRSPKAIPALGQALYDIDQEVRYHTVIALEKIRRQRHWAMSLEYFQQEEEQLLEYWRAWVKARVKASG